MESVMHVWINKRGVIFSTSKNNPIKGKLKNKTKYMGFTGKIENPLMLNTGRLLHL